MSDLEVIALVVGIAYVALYLGYLLNSYKIKDLEDKVKELERSARGYKHEDSSNRN